MRTLVTNKASLGTENMVRAELPSHKFYRHFMVDNENQSHGVCSPQSAHTQGASAMVRNEPLRMHTADPSAPPSFSLMQGKAGGLLKMLRTSGVGDVDKKVIDVALLKNRRRFLIGWMICTVVDGNLSASFQQSNKEANRKIIVFLGPLQISGLHK